jgi:hypothetical protein
LPREAKGREGCRDLIAREVPEGLVAIRELAEVTSFAWTKQEET